MSPRTLEDSRRWMAEGTARLLGCIVGLPDADVGMPSALPDWTVGQVIGHVAANADGLCNLVDWARTGVEKPMYASLQARNAPIEAARDKPAMQLISWFTASAGDLDAKLDELRGQQWERLVATRRGEVMASVIPWLRAREVWVHAVDLNLGVDFADLPQDFLAALVEDIAHNRGLAAGQLPDGPLPEVAAWLAGRPYRLPNAPDLGPWL